MSKKKEFYIGWSDATNPRLKGFLKKPFVGIFLLLPLLVLAITFFQKKSNDHLFEFGTLSQVSGVYYDDPVPMLIANKETLADGVNPNILLVGYGKFGAEGMMKKIQEEVGDLYGKQIMLEGTLIYGDGKTLLELKNENPLLDGKGGGRAMAFSRYSVPKELEGEILDPKCYFGVMKPAEGKIHKSCAIRCISGGIPPVLRTKLADGNYDYYIMASEKEKPINKEILDFVAEPISLKGRTESRYGWKFIFVDVDDIQLKR